MWYCQHVHITSVNWFNKDTKSADWLWMSLMFPRSKSQRTVYNNFWSKQKYHHLICLYSFTILFLIIIFFKIPLFNIFLHLKSWVSEFNKECKNKTTGATLQWRPSWRFIWVYVSLSLCMFAIVGVHHVLPCTTDLTQDLYISSVTWSHLVLLCWLQFSSMLK